MHKRIECFPFKKRFQLQSAEGSGWTHTWLVFERAWGNYRSATRSNSARVRVDFSQRSMPFNQHTAAPLTDSTISPYDGCLICLMTERKQGLLQFCLCGSVNDIQAIFSHRFQKRGLEVFRRKIHEHINTCKIVKLYRKTIYLRCDGQIVILLNF